MRWATSSVFPCGFSNFFVLVRSGCKKRRVLLGDDNFLHEKMSANMEDLNQESPDIVLLDSRTPLVLYHKVRSWEVWLIQHQLPKPCHLTPGLHMCSADASATSDALQCWCTWHAGPGITTQLSEAEGHCQVICFFQLSTVVQVIICFELTLPETNSWTPLKIGYYPKRKNFIFKKRWFSGAHNCYLTVMRRVFGLVVRTPFCWNPLIWSPWRRSFVTSWRTTKKTTVLLLSNQDCVTPEEICWQLVLIPFTSNCVIYFELLRYIHKKHTILCKYIYI